MRNSKPEVDSAERAHEASAIVLGTYANASNLFLFAI